MRCPLLPVIVSIVEMKMLLYICVYRWLVMRNRKMESLLVLKKVCGEGFVDSYFELKELEEAVSKHFSRLDIIKEILRWKYFSRYRN